MNYDDIINLPHHQSIKRKHMSMIDRAAQFGAFAALTGHDDAVKETARLTDRKIELGEDAITEINDRLNEICGEARDKVITITYFLPDAKKSGGKYITKNSKVKKIDNYKQRLFMEDETEIKYSDIYEIVINEV